MGPSLVLLLLPVIKKEGENGRIEMVSIEHRRRIGNSIMGLPVPPNKTYDLE
jgi:hypothetical protein